MKLSARQVETAKPEIKDYKLSDGAGLFLLVRTNGAKYWRYRYQFAGREKMYAIGVYPEITLAEARQKRDEARRKVLDGIDPVKARQVKAVSDVENTFRKLSIEWHEFKKSRWSAGYASDILEAFKMDIYPVIGELPVDSIEPIYALKALSAIEQRGATEKASKVRRWTSEVFKYAIATGRAKYNPVAELKSAMKGHVSSRFPFLTANELPDFLSAVSDYSGDPTTVLATKILMLTGLRTAELRFGEWSEIDFDARLWSIPRDKMKKRKDHLVPLSDQVIVLLKELSRLSGRFKYMFPNRSDPMKVMSENTINAMIKRIGWEGRIVGHGFRHTMSTILNDQGFPADWIELQLAHVDKNVIRGTYNHAQYLEGRREMLQWYADYIDKLCLI
ncbi:MULTISPECIES: tyrosine-type recombinase/integrase [unclassified Providencia]|uniref:tyrosine-type recombinase/integrase n=1 Tax=unclassified Providencia TaxID=2633465 RepID=UPI00234B98ED|nr:MULTISPECIES: integrase arm-type DNA-binding domain-containing protein [unclassified Providencia]